MKRKKRTIVKPNQINADKWCGQLEGYTDGYLYGWAINSQDTSQRVSLEICLDQEAIGLVSANLRHHHLSASPRPSNFLALGDIDPCHGFIAEVGKLHRGVSYTVRIANTQIYLPGLITGKEEGDQADEDHAKVLNLVYSNGGLRLQGYAVPAATNSACETLYAYSNGERVAQTKANLVLPALRGHFADAFGFEINLPLAFADNEVHTITVRNAAGIELNGSPIQVCCSAQGLKALLPDNQISSCDKLVTMYETYLPQSLGWSHYADWDKQFGRAATPASASGLQSLNVLFDNSGDDDDFHECQLNLRKLSQETGLTLYLLDGRKMSSSEIKQTLISNASEFTLLQRPGEILHSQNLDALISEAQKSTAKIFYGDTEFHGNTWFKPAWNVEYALASDYFLYSVMCRSADLIEAIPTPDSKTAPALWLWRLALNLDDQNPDGIVHFPYTVSHFPQIKQQRPGVDFNARLNQLLTDEFKLTASVHAHADGAASIVPIRQLKRLLSAEIRSMKVCLVIPTRDQVDLLSRCIDSIREFSNWPLLEIIVVDNGSIKDETLRYFKVLKGAGIKVIHSPGPFNYSYLNNLAVAHTNADVIGLINNDIEAFHSGWLEEMLSHFSDQRVAMVGAKLLWPNGMVQHGGVVLGPAGLAAHYGNLLHDDDSGHFGRNQLTQQLSAVTAACLLVRKADWTLVGGLNQTDFPVAFNDVDFCLKLRALGRRIIWTPFAKLLHLESASRGKEDSPQKQARAQREMSNLRRRWGATLLGDPSYHPSLNLDTHVQVFTGYALPPRPRRLRNSQLQGIPEQTLAELKAEEK